MPVNRPEPTLFRMNTWLDRAPVIVGVGEITLRRKNAARAMEPLAMMAAALRAAAQDAGESVLALLDYLDVVRASSWPNVDVLFQLSCMLGIAAARRVYGQVGGETPLHFIHEAALRIWRGESTAAAVVGAENPYAAAV